VVLLVYGPKKLPEIGRSLGKTIHDFTHTLSHEHSSIEEGEAASARAPSAGDPRERDSI
jgi:TatA/E family protein of Tat protein translocase